MLWEYLPPDRNPMSLVRIEGSSKRRRKPRILTPEAFAKLIAAVNREPCGTMVIVALCTGVRCSELVALKCSDFDWQNLSAYIRRAIVSGRVDDVKTEYSEVPPAARSRAGSDFRVETEDRFFRRLGLRVRIAVHGGREAVHTLEHAAQPSEPGRKKSRARTDGPAYVRHPYRAWLGNNGEPLTVDRMQLRRRIFVNSKHASVVPLIPCLYLPAGRK
jgi:integrase